MPFCCCSDVCRSEEHTSELQSHSHLVCRLLLEKKNQYSRCRRRGMLRRGSPVRRGRASACPRLIFFFNDPATPEIYPLSLPDALPISCRPPRLTIMTARRGLRFSGFNAFCRASRRSEEHTSELQSHSHLVCRLLL